MSKAATKSKEEQLEDALTEQDDAINKGNGTKKSGKKSTTGTTAPATEKKSSKTSATATPEKKAPASEAPETPEKESDTASPGKANQTKQKQAKPDTVESIQIICLQEKIKEQLSVVKLATPSKPTHAILGNVLIVTDEKAQQVILNVFDLSLGIETKFNAKVSSSGQLTLPVGLLTDIVGRFNRDSSINLNTTIGKEGQPTTTIRAETGHYQLNGMSAVEFPPFPSVESESTLSISVELLKEAIKRTSFAASNEETKQILTGVHIRAEKENIDFAATDGHRLSIVTTRCLSSRSAIAAPFSFTCPSKSLVQLERMLSMLSSDENGNSSSPSTVEIGCSSDSSSFEFTFGKTRLVGKYLVGDYPDYPNLVKQRFNHKVVLEKGLLVKALERISILADTDRKDKIVKIEFNSEDKQATISINRNFGKGVETIPAYIEGESLTIGFNLKFLLDGIKNTPSAEVLLELTIATGPAIITPYGNRDNPTLTLETKYLLMPVEFC